MDVINIDICTYCGRDVAYTSKELSEHRKYCDKRPTRPQTPREKDKRNLPAILFPILIKNTIR